MNLYRPIVVVAAVLLGGCSALSAVSETSSKVGKAHFALAMANEEIRCARPLKLVLRMADVKGDAWLNSYVQGCPSVLAAVRRIVGVTTFSRAVEHN